MDSDLSGRGSRGCEKHQKSDKKGVPKTVQKVVKPGSSDLVTIFWPITMRLIGEIRNPLPKKLAPPLGFRGLGAKQGVLPQKGGVAFLAHFGVRFLTKNRVFLVIFGTPFLTGPKSFRYDSTVISPRDRSKKGPKKGQI